MSLVGWLILGAVAGWFVNKYTDGKRGNLILNLALGLAGAFAGGFMFWSFGGGSMAGWNIYSMVVAAAGAAAALLTYHALFVYSADRQD